MRTSTILVRMGAFLAIGSIILSWMGGTDDFDGPLSFFLIGTSHSWGSNLLMPVWLVAPAVVGILVLAASVREKGTGRFTRVASQGACLGAAFAMATTGSILMGSSQSFASEQDVSFALSLFAFIVPVALGTVILARMLGGAEPAASAGFARTGLGLLLLLDGLLRMELLTLESMGFLLAWLALSFGGALIAVGETFFLVSRGPRGRDASGEVGRRSQTFDPPLARSPDHRSRVRMNQV